VCVVAESIVELWFARRRDLLLLLQLLLLSQQPFSLGRIVARNNGSRAKQAGAEDAEHNAAADQDAQTDTQSDGESDRVVVVLWECECVRRQSRASGRSRRRGCWLNARCNAKCGGIGVRCVRARAGRRSFARRHTRAITLRLHGARSARRLRTCVPCITDEIDADRADARRRAERVAGIEITFDVRGRKQITTNRRAGREAFDSRTHCLRLALLLGRLSRRWCRRRRWCGSRGCRLHARRDAKHVGISDVGVRARADLRHCRLSTARAR
jgi:hypothetical protein